MKRKQTVRAGRVILPSFHIDQTPKGEIVHSHTPLPTRPFPEQSRTENLSGRRFGKFTVFGFSAERATSGKDMKTGGKWVVLCVCGAYEHRRAKAIKNPTNTSDCCRECSKKK